MYSLYSDAFPVQGAVESVKPLGVDRSPSGLASFWDNFNSEPIIAISGYGVELA